MRQNLNFLFLILAWFVTCTSQAADPNLDWRTHESENFLIHYPLELQPFTIKVERLAEKSHAQLSLFFNWLPKNKTHIVLLDEVDQANGFATPIPNNSMTLFMQPPTNGELLVYDDWLEMLIQHEYTHILHIDKVLDLPSWLRNVFGRFILLFPNALHPNWFQEGLATYLETDEKNKIGRGQSDIFKMMMREEVVTGFKPLSRINAVSPHSWPYNSAYLYGVYFFRFIHDVYGENAIKQLVNAYSENIVPYQVNSNPLNVTGKTLEQLWPEFNGYLMGYFQPQLERIKKQAVTDYKIISSGHLAYSGVTISPENDVWYSANSRYKGPYLYRYTNGHEQAVLALNSLANLDINDDGQVLISQLEYCGQYGRYYDLFRLKQGSLQRITTCGRYRLAKWLSSERIVALAYEGGVAKLQLLDDKGGLLETLWQGKEGQVMSSFDIGGNGQVIAAMKFAKQAWNLYELNSGIWSALTDTQSLKINPIFYRGDIYFVQSFDGQFEAHKLNLKTKKIQRLTHSLTGLKTVLPVSDNTAISLRFSEQGFQLAEVEIKALSNFYLLDNEDAQKKAPNLQLEKSNNSRVVDQAYSPLNSLLPAYWLPVYNSNENLTEIGLFTSGSDALSIHQYQAQFSVEQYLSKPLLNVQYTYANRLSLGIQQSINNLSQTIKEFNSQLFMAYMYPMLKVQNSYYPYIAYVDSKSKFLRGRSAEEVGFERNASWLAMGFLYDGLRSSLAAGGSSDGWQASFSFESTEFVNNSIDDGHVINFKIRHYKTFKNHNVLAQKIFLGFSYSDNSLFQLGGVASDPYIGPGIKLKERRLSLRGFSDNEVALKGHNSFIYSAEYRLPFTWLDDGLMSPPVGVDGWSLRSFIDNGTVWDEGATPERLYSGLGIESIYDTNLAYSLKLRLRVGFAKGLGSSGKEEFYINFGGAF